MTDPKPMDPERLAELRLCVSARQGCLPTAIISELLADRDHQAAEAIAWEREARASRELREDMEMRMMLAQSEARRLESLRAKLGELVLAKSEDATYWEEKAHDALRAALKWRARSDVKGEDVEAAGVSEATAMAWALRNTYEPRGGGLRELFWAHRGMSSAMPAWMHPKRMHHDPDPVEVAGFINAAVAFGHGTPAFEVLDEMAAMEPPS